MSKWKCQCGMRRRSATLSATVGSSGKLAQSSGVLNSPYSLSGNVLHPRFQYWFVAGKRPIKRLTRLDSLHKEADPSRSIDVDLDVNTRGVPLELNSSLH